MTKTEINTRKKKVFAQLPVAQRAMIGEYLINGRVKYDAYIKCIIPTLKNRKVQGSKETRTVNAIHIFDKPAIVEYLALCDMETEALNIVTREELLEDLKTIKDTCISKSKFFEALKAIDQIAKMYGLNAVVKTQSQLLGKDGEPIDPNPTVINLTIE